MGWLIRYKTPIKIGLEMILSGVILFALYLDLRVFYYQGYLPPPFFHVLDDTFMDWYNTAYWGWRAGTYTVWGSVYPPLSFLFTELFSRASCYQFSPFAGRLCDSTGRWAISAFLIMGFLGCLISYWKNNKSTAFPRSVAVALGAPMLFAWERGNLIVPCFVFFVLAYGQILKPRWLRVLCAAVTVNFKPYLILVAIAKVIRRDWRWCEYMGIVCILVYGSSYLVFQKGSPTELIRDLVGYGAPPANPNIDIMSFATSYNAALSFVRGAPILLYFVGSRPLEWIEQWVPVLDLISKIMVGVVLFGAACFPKVLTTSRLSGLIMVLLFATGNPGPGGYSTSFLLFFVFQEKFVGWARITAVMAAYIWCIPYDQGVVVLAHVVENDFLSSRTVGHDLLLTAGEVVRPAIIFIMEFALVAASVGDFLNARRAWEVAGVSRDPTYSWVKLGD